VGRGVLVECSDKVILNLGSSGQQDRRRVLGSEHTHTHTAPPNPGRPGHPAGVAAHLPTPALQRWPTRC
jgi:hypothetical protein